MTFNCRSYIDALSANVQRVYSKDERQSLPSRAKSVRPLQKKFHLSKLGRATADIRREEREALRPQAD